METLLTLTIAVSGIVTGIGAIWAALVARRQAQVTERSLTEQNERLRLSLELDLLSRLQERFDSPHFLSRRRDAAKWFLENVLVDDNIVKVERVSRAVWEMLDFFEEVGYLQKAGILQVESVRINFGWYAKAYWLPCMHALQKLRERWQDPALYDEVDHLGRLVSDIDRERGIRPPTQAQLRETMEDEAALGEEPPTTTEW